MSGQFPILAVTSGEPAGIGPDLCLRLPELWRTQPFPGQLVVLGDASLLAERAEALDMAVTLRQWTTDNQPQVGTLDILHLPLCTRVAAGVVTPANAPYVLALLDRALAGCRRGEFAALVTAPVHKGVINDAGIPFTGHTEFLAEQTGSSRVVMMLVGGGLRVALVTTHLPLREVPAAITANVLAATVRILDRELRQKFAIDAPRILVAGLNPHAGEGGHLGREEIDVVAPTLERLRREEGMQLLGPLPADTIFSPAVLSGGDCVLAMYHDQGLTALKYASFGRGVNVTLGLPVIRTSVDHGTALDLAGTGQADPGSLFAAVEQALAMAQRTGKSG